MSTKLSLLKCSLIILTVVVPGFSQTAADLEKRYGSPIKEYEVRPGIVMMTTFSDDGRVCKMYVERRHFSETGFDQRLYLPQEMIIELIDELVPPEVRGGTRPKATDSHALRASSPTRSTIMRMSQLQC